MNDPVKVKKSLLAWAQQQWPEKSILNLGDLALQCESFELKKAICELDKIIYSGSQSHWDGETFWKLFQKTLSDRKREGKRRNKIIDEQDFLPKLYL